MWQILAKLVWGNLRQNPKLISKERFQFPILFCEIVKIPFVSLQVKKTQDGLLEGIYD